MREVRDNVRQEDYNLQPLPKKELTEIHRVYDHLVLFEILGNDIERNIPLVVCEISHISVFQEGFSTSFSIGSWFNCATFIILGRTIPPIKNVALLLSGRETRVKMVEKKGLVEVRGIKLKRGVWEERKGKRKEREKLNNKITEGEEDMTVERIVEEK